MSSKDSNKNKNTGGFYGSNTGKDTNFRRTWDTEKYRKRARDRELAYRERRKFNPDEDDSEEKNKNDRSNNSNIAGVGGFGLVTEDMHREVKRKMESKINSVELVSLNPIGSSSKQPGYFCESCDLTFRDNLSYMDHLNSRRHLSTIGVMARMHRSTVEDVRNKLESIRKQKELEKVRIEELNRQLEEYDEDGDGNKAYNLKDRVLRIQNEEMEEKIKKRQRYKLNRRP